MPAREKNRCSMLCMGQSVQYLAVCIIGVWKLEFQVVQNLLLAEVNMDPKSIPCCSFNPCCPNSRYPQTFAGTGTNLEASSSTPKWNLKVKKLPRNHPRVRSVKEIKKITKTLELKQAVKLRAMSLFETIHRFRTRTWQKIGRAGAEAAAAACVYVVCRQQGLPLLLNEIIAASSENSNAKNIRKCFSKIKASEELDIAVTLQPIKAESYINRFCKELGFPENSDVTDTARSVAKEGEELNLITGMPLSIAASAIYMAIQILKPEPSKSIEDIMELTGVGEATIKTKFRQLCLIEVIPLRVM